MGFNFELQRGFVFLVKCKGTFGYFGKLKFDSEVKMATNFNSDFL